MRIGLLAALHAPRLEHAQAVRGLRLACLGNGVAAAHQAVGVQDLLVRVFVVGDEQAALAAHALAVDGIRVAKGEQVHAVGVRTELPRLLGRGLAGAAAEGHAAGHHRIAPGDEELAAVAWRHGHRVGHRRGIGRHVVETDAGETQAGRHRRGLHRGGQAAERQPAGRHQRGAADAALHEAAALGIHALDHVADGVVGRRVQRTVVVGVGLALHRWLSWWLRVRENQHCRDGR
jgi:hypothetical protein